MASKSPTRLQGWSLKSEFAQELQDLLRRAEIKQVHLVEACGVDAKTVRRVLTGQPSNRRSIESIFRGSRRLLKERGEALSTDWLSTALIAPPASQEEGTSDSAPMRQEQRALIELEFWLHEDDVGPDREDRKSKFASLSAVLRESDHPLLVLLGNPGTGKSTALRALAESDSERQSLVFVPLVEYRGEEPPMKWLQRHWTRASKKDRGSLASALTAGQVTLLMDGLSEAQSVRSSAPAIFWSNFINQRILNVAGNRVIVSCRPLEYHIPMRTRDRRAPSIRIGAVGAHQIQGYLTEAVPSSAKALWDRIKSDASVLGLCSTAMFLATLVEGCESGGALPRNRCDLFRLYVWRALRNELEAHTGRLRAPLVSAVDQVRITGANFRAEELAGLPQEGLLLPKLSDLAWQMQTGEVDGSGERRLQVSLDLARRALSISERDLVDQVLSAGIACSFLDLNLSKSEVRFRHHMLQEFFAAVRFPSEDVASALETRYARAAGWEEVVSFAAGLSGDPEAFVSRVAEWDLPLAGKCAFDVADRLSKSFQTELNRQLLRSMQSGGDLQQRIRAGDEVRDLSCLDYRREGPAWVPPLRQVAGGEYRIGTETPEALPVQQHAPNVEVRDRHVQLLPFQVARYPVTNQEFSKFIQSGGYQDERWWTEPGAWSWRSGETSGSGMRWQLAMNRQIHRSWGEDYIRDQINVRWTESEAQELITRMQCSDEEFWEWAHQMYPDGISIEAPMFWEDPNLNRPSSPVVGVSWFEAAAYCEWISHVSRVDFRLLEANELEVAARGTARRRFAFGEEYAPCLANLHPTGLFRPSPVGMFPPSAEGDYDLTGNVWTWTSTVLPFRTSSVHGMTQVVFGGSYDTSLGLAPCYCRDANHPGYRDRYVGFRIGV